MFPPVAAAIWTTIAHLILLTIGILLTILASVLSIRSIRLNKEKTGSVLHTDKDGEATEQTQSRYEATARVLLAASTLISIAGLASAIAFGVFELSESDQRHRPLVSGFLAAWCPLLLWILIITQGIGTIATKSSVTRYHVGIIGAFTSFSLCAVLLIEFAPLPGTPQERGYDRSNTTRVLAGLNALFAVFAIVAGLSFPRTPDLFLNGRPVDKVRTVSALNRSTFTWTGAYLSHAWKSKQVEVSDFDALDAATRASELFRSMQETSKVVTGSLAKRLIVDHAFYLGWQYLITTIDACLIILPQAAMYRLLLTLERRDNGQDVVFSLWMWAVALGIAILIQGGVNNCCWYYGYLRVQIPWRVQLSAIIFEKAMRKKQVQGALSKKETEKDDSASTSAETLLGNDDATKKEEPEPEDGEANLQKMRQGVINLIGVDANRIGLFGVFNNAFLGAIIKLAVAFTFLGNLLGWQALLAGIAVQVAFMPINIYFSKRYSDSQDQLMKVRDRKLAAVNEALNGVRQIKFSALEDRWQRKIGDVRETELKAQWRVFESDTILLMCWILGPVLLSAASIAVYAVVHGNLPPSIAFTTIAILTEIEGTLAYIPELTTNLLDALVSLKRIQDYLDTPDKEKSTTAGDGIVFKDATVAWPTDAPKVDDDAFKVHKTNIEFPMGELSVIAGRTGSGKSLLLAAMLGEAEIIEGSLTVPEAPPVEQRYDAKATKGNWIIPSAIAFVSQQPWIENRTLRDNILFDLPHDEERYRKVLHACSLEQDIQMLADGELTEIGANGINLSGGQRWRVTLARALYSRAGILVMDDIFSAVDAHVGRHIFENALTGELAQGRTRVLVTHHVGLCLPATKYHVQLGDGKVAHAGLVDDLRRQNILDRIIEEEENEDAAANEEAIIDGDGEPAGDTLETAVVVNANDTHQSGSIATTNKAATLVRQRTRSSLRRMSHNSRASEAIEEPVSKQNPRKFVEEEKREEGRIKLSIYFTYFRASGGISYWILVLFFFAGYQGLLLGRSWVLRLWTENDRQEAFFAASRSSFTVQDSRFTFNGITTATLPIDDRMRFFLILYIGLAVVLCLVGTCRYLLVFFGAVRASRLLFNQMTYAILRAPLRWLDTVPLGRILNRFTADFNIVDSQLAYYASFLIKDGLTVVGIVIAAVIISPYIILTSFILFGICAYYAVYFLAGAREAKRLESTAKSPIFEFFSSALQGVTTVRAFGKAQSYVDQMFLKLDVHAETMWYQWISNRWLGWRLCVIGACFATITAALVVSLDGVDAALGGFALAFTLSYSEAIIWLLRNYAMVELGMNATERIVEYTEIPIEDQGGEDAPAIWPSEGRVEVDDLVVGYAPDLPPVLKGLTFKVERNERVGVVGRTGAGKSSLTLALFRFLEPRQGSIVIDGVDISKIKLHDLRSRLSIIAQDPVLFSGTIRTNLDPFSEYQDHELREALERCHLTVSSSAASTIAAEPSPGTDGTFTPGNVNPFASLTSPVTEGGLNLSQGQRQLLCLARAVVARPKVMVLDEATSAVDKATDELIQRSIREEFKNSTLIVIAHRLSTIADFDRILVMRDGAVAEFGTPKELLETKGEGVFRAMVDDSGEHDALREIILGRG